jgi:hypothetical protein
VLDVSKDQLPEFGELKKPVVDHVGPLPHEPLLPGVGASKEASTALFDELAPGMLGKKVYEFVPSHEMDVSTKLALQGTYVVIQLRDRATPHIEDFEKDYDWLVNEPCHYVEVPNPFGQKHYEERCGMRARRAKKLLESWIRSRCDELVKDQKIQPNAEFLIETNDEGKQVQAQYTPCFIAPQL